MRPASQAFHVCTDACVSMPTPAIRHNGSERVQLWVGFSRPVHNNVFCHFLSKCKHLAGHGGVLMVKVVPVALVGADPARRSSQTALRPRPLARYPGYPRGRALAGLPSPLHPLIAAFTRDPVDVYIELTGSLGGVVAACATLASLARAYAGRPPDSIACRLGRSVATDDAREWLADARVQSHFFRRDRWPACQTLGSALSTTCAFIEIASMLELVPGMAVQLRTDLTRRLQFPNVVTQRIMGYLSVNGWETIPAPRILRVTVYVIHVHARMFNDIARAGQMPRIIQLQQRNPATRSADETSRRNPRQPLYLVEAAHAPSLDAWADLVAARGPWQKPRLGGQGHAHPLVIEG